MNLLRKICVVKINNKFFTLLLLLIPVLSIANPIKVDNEIILIKTTPFINYGESGLDYDTSSSLDHELASGIELKFSKMSNMFHINKLYLQTSISYAYNQLHYRGSTFFTHKPYSFYQPSHLFDTNIDIGKGFFINKNTIIIPYITIGYHEWLRGEPIGYEWDENYSHYFIGPGIKLQYALSPNTTISLKASIDAIIYGKIHVKNAGFQYNGITKFHTTGMENIGLSLYYKIYKHIYLYYGASFIHFNYSGGNFKNILTYQSMQYHIYEPFSWTNIFTLKVGIGYRF